VSPPNKVRPQAKDRVDYSDFGDLQVAFGRDGLRGLADFHALETVEVKQRFNNSKYPKVNMDFQCRDEFYYPTVMVGIKKHYDKLDPEPMFTIVFNESLDGCLTINRNTRQQWTIEEKWVEKNGRKQTCYVCPKQLTTFYKVEL
jgi:hypothetical protein